MNFASLFDYNKDTGRLVWNVQRGKVKAGSVAGTLHSDGGIQIAILGKFYQAHRIAWVLATGQEPIGDIDHINGIRSDNRLCNLRDVSRSVNLQNQRRARSNSTTGYLGVTFHAKSKRWQARIYVNGKCLSLGLHSSPKQAHKAYVTAKRSLHIGNTL